MKVLQINAVYGIGSTGRMTKELHEYMLQNGIDSYVACSNGINPYDIQEIRIGNSKDVKIHALMARITGLQGYYSKKATADLIEKIKKINPDIVHLGNLHSNYINVKMLLKYLGNHNIATVIVLHDCWFYTGKCSHYTVDQCYRWKNKCGNCPRLKKDIPSWFFDRTTKMLEDKSVYLKKINRLGVIGVSEWICSEAKKSILKDALKITFIHNWIDTDTFKPNYTRASEIREQLNLKGKKIILGVSNIWNDAKGLNSFVELSKLLRDEEKIILIGSIDGIMLPQNVINIPPTNSVEDLVGYYTLADVFLQLSLEETFGKVVVEAMSCGTPAIVVDSTANSELITNETGYICELNNIIDIRNKIDLINEDSSYEYQISCREYVKSKFGMENQIEKYIKFYKELLK